MTNKEVGAMFRQLAKVMELHGENKFKIRSYQNAYMTLRKLDGAVVDQSEEELATIKGIGKAISSKIRELADTGTMQTLEEYRNITPPGVLDMLQVSGFGPSKVKTVWKDLGVESIGELLYAVNENRLIELKGFGEKTQADLKKKLEYFQHSQGQFLYAALLPLAEKIYATLQAKFPSSNLAFVGAMRRCDTVLNSIDLLISDATSANIQEVLALENPVKQENQLKGLFGENIPVTVFTCKAENWGSKLFRHTAGEEFMTAFVANNTGLDFKNLANEKAVFEKAGLPFVAPELRNNEWGVQLAKENKLPKLIEQSDIKGVIHSHTTYSDGLNTLEEMVAHARELGYSYIGITDHSKAAFYANGLKENRVWQQMEAIDQLNAQYDDFTIFKGIESDILANGSLDYETDLLAAFDFIIASVHSNLRMDEQKATERVLKAVENPYTSILGHPTGRLLLSRPGYPLDHKKIIDACAANGVSIELNANPYRLDIDWTWIPYAIEKGVLISINPDAHSLAGMDDIKFGVLAARKGGLQAVECLNTRDAEVFYGLVHRS